MVPIPHKNGAMCGRVALFTPPVRLARLLDAALAVGLDPDDQPSWNIGPQRQLFAVADRHEERLMDVYRWGLIPSWSKDPKIGNRLFNARAEGLTEKPSFRSGTTVRGARDSHTSSRAPTEHRWSSPASTSTGAVPKNRPTPR
jgi:SOS response associated peptidase (SRAP)